MRWARVTRGALAGIALGAGVSGCGGIDGAPTAPFDDPCRMVLRFESGKWRCAPTHDVAFICGPPNLKDTSHTCDACLCFPSMDATHGHWYFGG